MKYKWRLRAMQLLGRLAFRLGIGNLSHEIYEHSHNSGLRGQYAMSWLQAWAEKRKRQEER
jgi:hypothetical protein